MAHGKFPASTLAFHVVFTRVRVTCRSYTHKHTHLNIERTCEMLEIKTRHEYGSKWKNFDGIALQNHPIDSHKSATCQIIFITNWFKFYSAFFMRTTHEIINSNTTLNSRQWASEQKKRENERRCCRMKLSCLQHFRSTEGNSILFRVCFLMMAIYNITILWR